MRFQRVCSNRLQDRIDQDGAGLQWMPAHLQQLPPFAAGRQRPRAPGRMVLVLSQARKTGLEIAGFMSLFSIFNSSEEPFRPLVLIQFEPP
jgi:hypothetical protein